MKPGKHTVGFEFIRDKAGEHGESMGTGKLYIDDQLVAQGPMKTQYLDLQQEAKRLMMKQ